MTDARPINVRIFACPDVPGEWCAVCPELDVVAQDTSRPKALAMLADFVAMIETGDAMNGRDPFARASLSDDTASVYHWARSVSASPLMARVKRPDSRVNDHEQAQRHATRRPHGPPPHRGGEGADRARRYGVR